MSRLIMTALTAVMLAAAAHSGPASAAPISNTPSLSEAPANAESVRWRGRRGWGGGAAAGLAAGAIIGGIIASQRPYYYPYPGPYYASPDYYPDYYGPRIYAAPYPGDPVAYCMSRFRSYDPASGTYLGYDGFRHPCP